MNHSKSLTVDMIFVLALFSVYTLSSLFLAVIGADVYRNNADFSESNYNVRTSVLYLTEKVRQSENVDRVSIGTVNGLDALVLSQVIGEDVYNTWIYTEEGYLCEVLTGEGMEIVPGIGQKIMPINSMSFDLDDKGLLSIGVTDSKEETYNAKVFLECVEVQ